MIGITTLQLYETERVFANCEAQLLRQSRRSKNEQFIARGNIRLAWELSAEPDDCQLGYQSRQRRWAMFCVRSSPRPDVEKDLLRTRLDVGKCVMTAVILPD